jgi:hypothetical protein
MHRHFSERDVHPDRYIIVPTIAEETSAGKMAATVGIIGPNLFIGSFVIVNTQTPMMIGETRNATGNDLISRKQGTEITIATAQTTIKAI